MKAKQLILALLLMWPWSSGYSVSDKEQSADQTAAVDVYVDHLKKRTVFDPVVYGGFVKSTDVQELFTPVEGFLEQVFVQLGQRVKKGDHLYSFKPNVAGHFYNKQLIVAPRSGIISFIADYDTNRYKAGETLMIISAMDKKIVRLQVNYEDMIFLKSKPPMSLTAHKGTSYESAYPCAILSISPVADPVTSTFTVDVRLDDVKGEVPIGTFMEAEVRKNQREAFVVPITALNSQRNKVFTVQDQVIEVKDVKLGRFFEDTVEIVSGLDEGKILVTKYAELPKEGDKANIIQPRQRKVESESKSQKTRG